MSSDPLELSDDIFNVEGKVYNGGSTEADGVIVWAAIYREDGIYAGVANESIGAAIPPGKTARFRLFTNVESLPGILAYGQDAEYTYQFFVNNIPGGIGRREC